MEKAYRLFLWTVLMGTYQVSFEQPAAAFAKTDSLLTALEKQKDFSGTVLIAKDGHVLYEKFFGYADFEKNIRNNATTRFCIGSISKSFTATAIMKLQEEGKLRITDHLKQYIPDFPQADKITIEELLVHTSGVKREIIDDDEDSKKYYTTTQIIDTLKKYPLDFTPGTRQSYSNGGYAVLARIVEIVSGKNFSDYLNEVIFKPLGMTHTLVFDSRHPADNTAKGYEPGLMPHGVEKTLYEDASQNIGAGSIYSTAEDLLKWDRSLHDKSILSKSTLDTMFKYGFGRYKHADKTAVGHDGIVNGYIASMDSFMDDGVSIILLCNVRTGVLNLLSNGLAEMYYKGNTVIPPIPIANEINIPAKDLQQFTGVYELFPGFDLTVKEEKGVLYLKGKGGYYTLLNALAPDKFFYRSLFSEITFKTGDAPQLVWRDILSGQSYPAKKK